VALLTPAGILALTRTLQEDKLLQSATCRRDRTWTLFLPLLLLLHYTPEQAQCKPRVMCVRFI
jgi:hypothetical protein